MLARVLRGMGELLMTAGVVCLLFVAYLLWWTDFENSRTQGRLSDGLAQSWAAQDARSPAPGGAAAPGAVGAPGAPPASPVAFAPPALGQAFARLYIPRLGRDYDPVVVEGVSTADLQEGPGHYPGTALPGQRGNMVISGHRTTWGKPFNRLDEVQPGDRVVVETRTAWVTYRVTGDSIVDPSASEVITDVPPPIGVQPSSADTLLTLTTCNPKYSAQQRLILRGVLETEDAKKPGLVPLALQDGQA